MGSHVCLRGQSDDVKAAVTQWVQFEARVCVGSWFGPSAVQVRPKALRLVGGDLQSVQRASGRDVTTSCLPLSRPISSSSPLVILLKKKTRWL